ncbi:MAG TPA: gliding motility-associated C-terminal domain-containing protein [Puia sp.]|nr:gliding motility-associated C-terminal domain-containing protein [Puia sp.]
MFRHPLFTGCILMLLAALLPSSGSAQARGTDTISYSSTCVNSTILFSSPLLDTFYTPDYIEWHFSDPASGYNDSSGANKPRHLFAATGQYPVELDVWYKGSDTIKIRDTITIVTPMNFNFGPDIYVCGKKPDTLISGPNIPGATYTWNDADTTHTDTIRITKSGIYTVAVNGCGVTDSIGVFSSDTPRLDLGKDHIMCDSANLQLDAASQNGRYTWLLDGAALPDTGDQLITHYPGGTYVAIVTVPGCGVYSDTVSITYSQPLAPPFDLGPDTLLCPKQVFTLDAAIPGATAYDWNTGSTDSVITITATGDYFVFVTYKNQCQVTDSVLVTYRDDKPLDFHDTAICKGSTLVLNADFGQGTYKWTAIPPQRDDQNQTGQSTYFVYEPGKYAVLAQVGQCVYTDTLTVRFDDSLRVTMPKDTTLCYGEDFLLRVAGNADTLVWQDGSYGDAYRPAQPGIYTVVARNGCGTDTLTATVNFTTCGCQLLLPNAFTPDGDGHNDTFRPLHACEMTNFEMTIYNRYGELVFRSVNPDDAWDGRFRGARVQGGAYVWMARYFNPVTKQPVFRKGTVLVIR